MQISVDLLLPDGSVATLGHGGIIGRLPTASLCIPDPRVSEAHAMVSLRGHAVRLLGLRGRFFVDGQTRTQVDLLAGMEVHLARDVTLRVLEVRIPSHVLAIRADGMPLQTLLGLTSVYADPARIDTGWNSDADEVLWLSSGVWMRGSDARSVAPGPLAVGGVRFELVEMPTVGAADTRAGTGFRAPLTLECFYDAVHIHRAGRVELTLTGMAARVVSELVTLGQPISWEALARTVWGEMELASLRKRWDTHLYRLRVALRKHHIRTDLVQSDGTGLVQLVLAADDETLDRT